MMRPLTLSIVSVSLALPACIPLDDASRAEMRQAVIEIADLGAADGAQAEILELTTSFTIGAGVAAAREELRDFVTSQIPCSTVTLADATLTIDFGDMSDSCLYRGRTYAGVVSVSVDKQGDSWVVVHTYDGMTGGRATLDGTATVTWTDNERHIVTDLDIATDRGDWHVEADRTETFTACPEADAVCVDIDGDRTWTGPNGDWDMTIAGVRARSIDPVPEAGTYSVENPNDKQIELSFSRVDDDTIEVSVQSGRLDFAFHVTALGQVSDA
jgi:hypothetical protein